MDMLSFITDDRSYVDDLNKDEPCLHPDYLVVTALKMMSTDNLSSVAICKNGRYLGRIYANELQRFVDNSEDELVYHRLNFDLETAIAVMRLEQQ
ncbi:putative transcriptional regulator [Pedobacter africanus]|uniref:Transcriptional regulator n=1 Tax=Pedobacter africanus TaxID=151894 RepID=A0ACC6KW73_9SPHI|nr:hypothetical protein [Pedobacter africanus]MDR6783422.1 putative transcriptional regulator [Pedobacter africanus]